MYTHVYKPLALLCCLAVQDAFAEDVSQNVAASKQAIQAFSTALKSTLMEAIKDGGAAYAVEVCNLQAPQIAASVSSEFNGQISRTSLKVRNQTNTPDNWERRVLDEFETRKTAGEDIATLEYQQVFSEDGQSVLRYMKAIPTQQDCLACHGSTLDHSVEKALAEHYANDEARGFEIGDIRGAFSVRMLLDPASTTPDS